MPTMRAIVEGIPVALVRHARRLSKVLAEYSIAELNTLVNVPPPLSLDARLRRMPFI